MKKRDLTKLALMGIAIGLCGGQIQADDLNEGLMDEQMLVASCGSGQCGGGQPQQYPQGQGQQKTRQGYLLSEAPPIPDDHPASEKPNLPPPSKVNLQPAQSNNNKNQGRPTADNTNPNMNGACGAKPTSTIPQKQNPNSTTR